MAYYEWTERLSVGIPSIDRQHKTLISYINSLAEATNGSNGNSPVLVGLVLDNLIAYTRQHFIYEEMLFDRYGYQEAEDHKLLHGKLAQQVVAYKTRYTKGDSGISKELLAFLMGWLNRHIMVEDIAYSEFLLKQGCK